AVEYGVAVANAIETLREAADRASAKDHADAVIELIDDIIAHDLQETPPRKPRRTILLGHTESGEPVCMPPAWTSLLIAGTSGSGKSTLATGVLERLCEQGYQFCVIDPEGDYEDFSAGIVFGNAQRAPSADEVLTALEKPSTNAIVNLVGLALKDRPAFFADLLPQLQTLRAKTGRPHWVLVDETHHLMPREWKPAPLILSRELAGMIYVTVHPDQMSPSVVRAVHWIAALGDDPQGTVQAFAETAEISPPLQVPAPLESGEAVLWRPSSGEAPIKMRVAPCRSDRRRHRRKYAEGELAPERSFYFQGPQGKLNLRAQNLILFLQLADGVDDETWLYHLHAHDYSKWMREYIKNAELG